MFGGVPPQVAAEAAKAVDRLGIGPRVTWDALVGAVERCLGKSVRVVPADEELWANVPVTGLLVEYDDHFRVLYRESDTPLYRRHSVLHEFGHVLVDQVDCHALETLPEDLVASVGLGDAVLRSAARGLDVGEHELAAESAAFLLATRLMASDHDDRKSVFGL